MSDVSAVIIMRTLGCADTLAEWAQTDIHAQMEDHGSISKIWIDEMPKSSDSLAKLLDEKDEPYVIIEWADDELSDECPFRQIRSEDAEERLGAYVTPQISVNVEAW